MDRKLKQLRGLYEGFFGLGKKAKKYSSMEEIQSHIQKALDREDGMQFSYFHGNGIRLAIEIAGLIGMTNYVRPGAAQLGGDEGSQLIEKSIETQATWQCFCVGDDERHKMRMFLSSTDVRELVKRLPKIAGYMEEMNESGIEDFDPSGIGSEATLWLDSMVGAGSAKEAVFSGGPGGAQP